MKVIWRAAALFLASALSAEAADKVRFGTNWLAQAEHGGFYQAVADGGYAPLSPFGQNSILMRKSHVIHLDY